MSKPSQVMQRYLFDGQTKELLAVAATKSESSSGMVYKDPGGIGYDKATEYIYGKMKDVSQ
jgi:hypothetical protein